MKINNVDSFVDRDMFLRYSSGGVGHTAQMLPVYEDTAMDFDDTGKGMNQGEGTGTEVSDDEGCDSGMECEDSDDVVSLDSDREDEDLGSEDGEDDFYDMGYSAL